MERVRHYDSDKHLLKLLGVPSVNLLLGKRRAGKSAFGYRVLELAARSGMEAQVLGLPEEKYHLLPDSIHPISSISEMKDDAVILMDEAYGLLFAREAGKSINKTIAKVMGAVGQKRQVLLFATHLTRKIDVSCVYESDNLIFKMPSPMHARMERTEVRPLMAEAQEFFKEHRDDYREYAYVIGSEGTFSVRNRVPSFWTEDLSTALSGVDMEKYLSKEKKEPEIVRRRLVGFEYEDSLGRRRPLYRRQWKG